MVPVSVKQEILSFLTARYGQQLSIEKLTPVSGGDINEAWKVSTDMGDFFLKLNHAGRFPKMFEKEARGLKILEESGAVNVPEAIHFGEMDEDSFLLMHFVEPAPRKEDFWEDFGSSLARLHRNSGESFGLDHDNYIGSLYQYNRKHDNWNDFFVEERLERQLKLARDASSLGRQDVTYFERLYKKIPEIFPEEPPALLHGDLWGGNFIVGNDGLACIIDPAVYYGHREMDIGMSRLFGGFSAAFYRAYNDEYPMEKNWEDRIEICNLYPLMVHVNLFGGGYVDSVRRIIRRF